MEVKEAKKLTAQTGALLLEKKLVARTWGNISCRIDETVCAITPSGLDYQTMTEDDIPVVSMKTGTWTGRKKPSGEKHIHLEAYQIFPDVNFVIHTHQTYATAVSLTGMDKVQITADEKEKLGGIGVAGYGLPGTKKLTGNVRKEMEKGAKVVLMAHHGVLICGANQEETIAKAVLLEEICRRNVEPVCTQKADSKKMTPLFKDYLQEEFGFVDSLKTPELLEIADSGETIPAQLDDMAQMIGGRIVKAKPDGNEVRRKLLHHQVLLVPTVGAMIRADSKEDVEALKLLVQKAAICSLYTKRRGQKATLPAADVTIMHLVYTTKYAKLKKGE